MLYQKVRPSSLSEIIGNSGTVGVLQQQIRKNPKDRFHTILFQGPKGCGKTTLARIIANEYGADKLSTFELNVPNDGGVETTRRINEEASFRSLGGKAKVYIFDECHNFSSKAWDDLLKILEDTPEYCYFILCTTNPQKVKDTIQNRCLILDVAPLTNRKILELLDKVVQKEELNTPKEVLETISCNSSGTPRTALILLEKVIGVENPDEAIELVISESEQASDILDLCKLLVMVPSKRKEQWKRVLTVFESIKEQNSERIRQYILGFLRRKLLEIDSKDVNFAEDFAQMMEIFSTSTFYGGRNLLAGFLVKVCFINKEEKKEQE